jgi:PAS domain S-box-containing protein
LAPSTEEENSFIRVLHVDDDCATLEIAKLILLDMNVDFEIDQACCVDDAFKKLSIGQYDVVVSDYEMPQKDGLQFLKELREQKNKIPFILFTGKGREEIAIKALNFGADGYYNKQGSPETVYGELSHSIRAVAEHKRVRDALTKNESKYRLLADNSLDVIWTTDLEGQTTYVSPSVYQLRGYTAEEARRQSLTESLTPDSAQVILQGFQSFWETGAIPANYLELEQTCKDGSTVWTEVNFNILRDKDRNPQSIIGVSRNITKRKQAEKALIEIEKRSTAIVAYAPIGIATSGADKFFLGANESFCKILGYNEKELQKLTFKDITHPKDIKESSLKICELENGKISSFSLEKQYVRKDGTVIDGKIMVSAVLDQRGKPNLFVAELEDITDRKKTEERRKILENKVKQYSEHLKYMVDLRTAQLKDANERLLKAERLAAIGELAGMVGHDLRNPLAGIKNAVYILKKKGRAISEAQAKETLEIIDKAIDHSNKIITDLLDYAREMHLKLIRFAARPLVNDAARMIQVPDRIQIVNQIDEDIWIWVDAGKMIRVFINLLQNAIDAIPENGTIEITGCQRSDRVEITFADTGKGIPTEVLPRLFTPLFTTKAQGMGFGLSICKRIIEVHGGTIKVETAIDKGTRFTINLPAKIYPEPKNKKID